ncbi:MAG: NAD-dependent epimerase/dehydratase family protein [Candidatus Methylomirabilales bacterium]
MVTFLTGATGFIGGAVLERLLREEGARVMTLVRHEEAARQVVAKGAHPVLGDVLSPETYREVLHGCDLLFHAAGLNAFCPVDPRLLYEVNVEGTRTLLHAAGEVGVKRILYTSSALTIGEPPGSVAREETIHRGYFLSHYERAKYEAEQIALALARQGLPVIILNPSSVQGPGRLHGTARILLDYLNGRLPFIFGNRFSFLYIEDCVEAHVKAVERGRVGERYLLSGPTATTEELIQTMEEVTGLRKRPWKVGSTVAVALGAGMEWGGRLVGRRPKFCREMARTLLHGGTYDTSKAKRELDVSFTPLREMVAHTVAWYAEAGHVNRLLPGLVSGSNWGCPGSSN